MPRSLAITVLVREHPAAWRTGAQVRGAMRLGVGRRALLVQRAVAQRAEPVAVVAADVRVWALPEWVLASSEAGREAPVDPALPAWPLREGTARARAQRQTEVAPPRLAGAQPGAELGIVPAEVALQPSMAWAARRMVTPTALPEVAEAAPPQEYPGLLWPVRPGSHPLPSMREPGPAARVPHRTPSPPSAAPPPRRAQDGSQERSPPRAPDAGRARRRPVQQRAVVRSCCLRFSMNHGSFRLEAPSSSMPRAGLIDPMEAVDVA